MELDQIKISPAVNGWVIRGEWKQDGEYFPREFVASSASDVVERILELLSGQECPQLSADKQPTQSA
jgi:hypothetical protein